MKTMTNFKTLATLVAAAAIVLASCTREPGAGRKTGSDGDVAYMSIVVSPQKSSPGTRANSEEKEGLPTESALKTLYVITFDAAGSGVAIPGGTNCYKVVSDTGEKTPEPFKISAASKNIVVVANPGPKLTTAIEGLVGVISFETFNKDIAEVTTTEIVTGDGFTMISAGDEKKVTADNKVLYPYVEIGNYIQVVEEGKMTEAQAKEEAAKNRLPVKLERLAAKLVLTAVDPIAVTDTKKVNDKVKLDSWTVDAVNTTYFPFAVKTLLGTNHTGADYTRNFYTRDPNFSADTQLGYSKGLARTTIAPATYDPVLPFKGDGYYKWMTPVETEKAYVIENTMAADNQRFGSTTRVIMKATYTPEFPAEAGYTAGADWFSWRGTNYPSLAALQKACENPDLISEDLKKACVRFYDVVKAAKPEITATDFATLKEADLTGISNGGQRLKNGTEPIIFWYQGGRCYYSYEIRHDEAITGTNEFAKYGVVRNNWYDLELRSVRGPGTPWYPEATDPGPGDPDPKSPIDSKEGYVGIEVDVNGWIWWKTGIVGVD